MLKISHSELIDFRDCRRKWYLRYYLRFQPPEKKYGPLALGTNIHHALATYYSPGGLESLSVGVLASIYDEYLADPEINTTDKALIEKDAKLAKIMLEGYYDWVEETGADSDLEIVEAEAEIEHDIVVSGVPVRLMGKRDAIGYKVSTGISTLIDHKTCRSFNDPALDLNEQARMYLLLQRLKGSTPVQNCLWNLLRKVQRTAKAIPPFYAREELYISEDELRRFWTRINGIIAEIIEVRRRLDAGQTHYAVCYPRPSGDCSWKCAYRLACPLMDSEGDKALEFINQNFNVTDPYARYAEIKGE